MSNEKNKCDKHINESCGYQNCCKNEYPYKDYIQPASDKSLLKYYEECDSKDILTSNGHNIMYKVKTGLVYAFWIGLILLLASMKKTLDNIEARVHNTPSVTTK